MAAQPIFTNHELMDMFMCYAQSENDAAEARRKWIERYPDRPVPSCEKIIEITKNLKEHGSFIAPKDPYAPPLDLEPGILEFVEDYPHLSIREVSRRFDVTGNTVRDILRKNNERNYNYLFHRTELSPQDREDRVNYSKWMQEHLKGDYHKIVWAGEALFSKINMVTDHSKNWWTLREKVYQNKPDEPKRFSLNVWGAVCGQNLIGPYFTKPELKQAPYPEILKNAVEELMMRIPENERQNLWWYHHISPREHEDAVKQYLNEKFGDHWIGVGGPVPSPTHCLDLIPTDYCLWRQVKRHIYKDEIKDEQELRAKIVAAFDKIRQDQ
ncbi:hypothetical protein NE865_13620 [Phthorimaea operculella]|nr:hypothetical protein NE865_13620 [Phthorimaea operculella]